MAQGRARGNAQENQGTLTQGIFIAILPFIKGLIRPFKGLIRPLRCLIRPFKGLMRGAPPNEFIKKQPRSRQFRWPHEQLSKSS